MFRHHGVVVLAVAIAAFARPARADTSATTSTRTTGGDRLGASCTTTVVSARNADQDSVFRDAKSCSVKIIGRTYKVWSSLTDVVTKIPGSLSFSHATPIGSIGISVGEGNYSIGLSKGFQVTRHVFKKGAQVSVGPVPVYLEISIGASIGATPGVQKNPSDLRLSLTLSTGINGSARATVGVSFAHVGIEGTYSPFTLNHTAAVTVRAGTTTCDVTGNVSWSYGLSLVARAGWFNYSYPFLSGGGAYGRLQWTIYRRTIT